MSNCPVCHQSVASVDDICENCGAVLVPVQTPDFVAASSMPLKSVVAMSAGSSLATATSAAINTPGICQNCKQMLTLGDDICENCGMVVDTSALKQPTFAPVSSNPDGIDVCPQCGSVRVPGIKFCRQCGTNLMGITAPATTGQPSAPKSSAPITPTAGLVNGSIINNKYKIVREIGAGGMGAVYLAEDLVLKRQVVIKALLSSDDPDLIAQSVKEREFLASVKHANIVSIYDFITISSHGYIVMEYVHGKTLEDMMLERGKPFDVPEAIRYILNILPAFAYLARLKLVYCDFKPQNVMVEILKDGSEVVKLIDLGTVIKYTPYPGEVYGTHGFYAPEAVKNPSPETDLYSICRTLAFLVTQMDLAQPAFGMPSSEYYKAFRDYPALYRLLTKGTHSKPSLRFRSAEELTDQLTGVLRQIVGGSASVPVASRLFVPGILTTTGKLGLRGEAALDEKDPAIDLLRFGDQALRAGSYEKAAAYYQQAIKTNVNSIDGHLRLAEVYIDRSEYVQALAEVTQVQRKAPGNWKVAWYTARLLEAQGKLSTAADQYRELIADLPGELPPQQALARVCARLGDYAGAVDYYGKVIKADPGNAEAILGAANAYINLQRWDEAAQMLEMVNEAAARYIEAQLLLCDLYLTRIQPQNIANIQRAAQVIDSLTGKTHDPLYYLMSGDIYYAAYRQVKRNPTFKSMQLPRVRQTTLPELGRVAENNYREYLRREKHPVNREAVVRRKLQVAPWRLF